MKHAMPLNPDQIDAILFDYGNTLIEFSHRQIEHCDRALGAVLSELFGPYEHDRLVAIRNADRLAPYQDGFRENDLPTISRRLVRQLYGRDATEAELAHLLEVRFSSFVESITVEPGVVDLLRRLKQRRRLALVSNYPCGRSIRASLDRTGIGGLLDAVVASGDVGRVKPHPIPFRTALDALGVAPERAVYIGDNWLADVQGAKRLGMQAVHIRQWDTPEKFDREPDHHDADAVIDRLAELESLL